jgi:hypothetical protein
MVCWVASILNGFPAIGRFPAPDDRRTVGTPLGIGGTWSSPSSGDNAGQCFIAFWFIQARAKSLS